VKIDWGEGEVTAVWDRAPDDSSCCVLLTHGAGGDMNDPVLKAAGSALADRNIAVLRFNLPYREAGRKSVGSPAQAEACWRGVVDRVRGDKRIFVGGKSYGGRMATHVAAAGHAVDGLMLLSYPLHPPGKPDRLRTAHLADITVPMLFVQGTKDPFATADLLERTIASLPNATHVPIQDGEHSLRVRGRQASEVAAEIAEAISAFVR
jgi:uncharacterized protein